MIITFLFKQKYKMHTEAFYTWFIQHLMPPQLWQYGLWELNVDSNAALSFFSFVCKVGSCHLSWVARKIWIELFVLLVSCPYRDENFLYFCSLLYP